MKALITAAALILLTNAAGAQKIIQGPLPESEPMPVTALLEPTRTIVVSLEDHKLALMEDGGVLKMYTVAVGKPSTPSPEGEFIIARRVANPTYQHNGKTIPAGPNNPVGTRWMGLSKSGYGIHGTNEPNSIGKSASHGCIRMGKADLEEFYQLVSVGDTVQIIGHRNQQTAALFNPTPAPSAAAQAHVETPAPALSDPAQALAPDARIAPALAIPAPIAGSR